MWRYFLAILILVLAVVVNSPMSFKIGTWVWNKPSIDWRLGTASFYRDMELKYGLDLLGGTHLTYEASVSGIPIGERQSAVDSAKLNIEKRVNLLGVAEANIQTAKSGESYRLIVELPGLKDSQSALAVIGQTAFLEFRESRVATPSSESDFISTGLSGKDLKISTVQFSQGNKTASGSQPTVGLEFTADGAKKFAEITAKNIGKPVAIFLDNAIVTAPIVQSVITDGRAVISGNFDLKEAKNLVIQLNAGALPIPIKVLEHRSIGATLGQESILKSVVAGVIGLALVSLFMIINYGVKGLIADLALIFYLLLSLMIMRLVPVTLTLAGIAGLILSIGMAVDANILIFERIKEELGWGRPLESAIELGFHRAWNSIKDSNISSLITASILFWFGTGSVRGFALTLAIGIFVSLFTAVVITKMLLKLIYRT
jgi:preprotein translocase subunit SecD